LQLNSCAIQGNEPVKPMSSVNPSITPSVLTSITPSPDPNEKYKGLELYSETNSFSGPKYCEPETNIKSELKYPLKIAVSKDGYTVYFVNGLDRRAPSLSDIYTKTKIDSPFHFDPETDRNIVKRSFIYKINKEKKIEIVKVNNVPLLSCKNIGEIALDNDDNLFISDNEQNIYKLIYPNNLIKMANVKERAADCPDPVSRESLTGDCTVPFLSGPFDFYFHNNSLYFKMYAYGEASIGNIKKLDENLKVSNVLSTLFWYLELFAIHKDKLYILENPNINEYSLTSISSKGKSIHNLNEITIDPTSGQPIDGYIQHFTTNMRINSKGAIFFNDLIKHCIWKVEINSGILTRFAGSGKQGFKDGKGEEAEFNYPTSMDFDSGDNLYIADTGNNAIRKITPDGAVSTFYNGNK
jgi:hypothetical protein